MTKTDIKFAINRFIYDLHVKPKKWLKRLCPHIWRVYHIYPLPMFTEHFYEECRICKEKRDYYKNPNGKFTL